MGLLTFLKLRDSRRETVPGPVGGKPAADAPWADVSTAPWLSPATDRRAADPFAVEPFVPKPFTANPFTANPVTAPVAANPVAAEPAAPDRRRTGRHARRNSGHHGSPGHHARASLAALAFG
jgi:hypothetical protein